MAARIPLLLLLLPGLTFLTPVLGAQSNQVSGLDVELASVSSLMALGREGVYPAGENGLALATTICNVGTVEVPWFAPMSKPHPVIGFLILRESNGRMEQISDYSFLKHGFAALTSEFCSPCTPPTQGAPGQYLGLGCSDTYGVFTNGDSFWLGPPEEIDPWLGEWQDKCGQFDRGEPAVAPPFDCDQVRSLTSTQVAALGPIAHRIRVQDAELDQAGTFWYQAYYNVQSEPEAARENNMASREFVPTWNGSAWDLASTGPSLLGSVLERWSGASVASATNGDADGRVYVAVRVSGPTAGMYHYEYAIQNRDNRRGVRSFRIPLDSSALVQGVGFHDVDEDGGNQWTVATGPSGLVFEDAAGTNPLRWNSVYNVWFDVDRAPTAGQFTLGAASPGAGAPSFAVPITTPAPLSSVTRYGCNNPPSSLTLISGVPTPGTTLEVGVDSPGGWVSPGAASFLVLALAPHPAYPCGIRVPQRGLRGEVLLGLRRQDRVTPTLRGGAWSGPGSPASVTLELPGDPALLGRTLYLQGGLQEVNPAGSFGQPRTELTDALELFLGF